MEALAWEKIFTIDKALESILNKRLLQIGNTKKKKRQLNGEIGNRLKKTLCVTD